MNKQDALAKCKAIKDYLTAGNPVWDKEEVAEAMNMAIEMLEEEPVNVDTDKIVKCIKRCYNREQPIGHWKSSNEVFGDGFEDAVCSLCRWESEYPVEYIRRRYKFCPHCGTKMVKEGESDEDK